MLKKVFGVAFVFAAYLFLIHAIEGQEPEPLKDKVKVTIKGERIALPAGWSKIGLSKDQTAKIYALRQTFHLKIVDLQKQLDTTRAAEKGELMKLLTPAQVDQLKKLAGF